MPADPVAALVCCVVAAGLYVTEELELLRRYEEWREK